MTRFWRSFLRGAASIFDLSASGFRSRREGCVPSWRRFSSAEEALAHDWKKLCGDGERVGGDMWRALDEAMGFRASYDPDLGAWVGTCDRCPNTSRTGRTVDEALRAIRAAVASVSREQEHE